MKVPVYNKETEVVGEVELNEKIFGIKASKHLLAEAVRVQQSNARGGLAHTKTRGDVRGGGIKPWKQKGTGRARAGSTRSPIWRKGGVTFGPRSNRNWELKINKKAKTKALFMSLSDKAKHGKILVLENIVLAKPAKTKEFVGMMKAFKAKFQDLGKRHMLLLPKKDDTLFRASRNVQSVTGTFANQLNVVDVLKADQLWILKDSLSIIEKTFLKTTLTKDSE